MTIRSWILGGTLVLAAAGCYRPEGAFIRYTGEAATYWSPETRPVTITVVDTRTDEPFFTMEVPVGKQLVIDFKAGEGDDPVLTPDLMRWEVFARGTKTGALRNAMAVPNSFSRRIDVEYRPTPEYELPAPDQPLRVDVDRPGWWSPKGGPIPDPGAAMTVYDD